MLKDRSRNIMDGGYVNAPDYHNKGTGKDIGLREYNSNVLVHNWFEERTPVGLPPFNEICYRKKDVSLGFLSLFVFKSTRKRSILRTRLIDSTTNHFPMQSPILSCENK